MNTNNTPTILTLETARQHLRQLGLYGLQEQAETLLNEPWLAWVIAIEHAERQRRSLKRRLDEARVGAFKPLADFDWTWPEKCDRPLVEELFSLGFLQEAANVVLIGPNGLGKTMLAKNLVHQAVLHGHTARFTLASDMLHDLAARDSSTALARRLRRYTRPAVLAIDEVGYLSYDARYADLLFEVLSRRYQHRPIILTTNKIFSEWNQVFSNAACVVTLVDRLLHRAEILALDGKSYRLKEAQERATRKASHGASPVRSVVGVPEVLEHRRCPSIIGTGPAVETDLIGVALALTVHFTAETRFFTESPGFPEQHGRIWSPSAVLQAEIRQAWNESCCRFTAIPFLRLDANQSSRSHFDMRVQRLSPGFQLGFPFRFWKGVLRGCGIAAPHRHRQPNGLGREHR